MALLMVKRSRLSFGERVVTAYKQTNKQTKPRIPYRLLKAKQIEKVAQPAPQFRLPLNQKSPQTGENGGKWGGDMGDEDGGKLGGLGGMIMLRGGLNPP